nr:exopolyphosphatase PRUNE1-like isoform X2 [Malus domestica]
MRSRSPSPRAVGQPNQVEEPYNRARHNPFFDGLLRLDDQNRSPPTVDFQAIHGSRNISRTMSDIGNTLTRKGQVPFSDDSVLKPFEGAKFGKTASFAFANVQSAFSFDLRTLNEPAIEANDHKHGRVNGLASATSGKSFRVNRRKENLSTVSLPQSAASFYSGDSPQFEIVASCPSIYRLNLFLKATKDEVNAGVPEKFLHVVMAEDIADVGSIVSTITYAFYLNETQKCDQLCTVPVINMKRSDINSQAELKWLLDSCQIDQSSLIFVDEIDLSYYDLFGSLKIVLLNGHKLPAKQEGLKEAVVEIFNCKQGESVYPWVKSVTVTEDSSCCTVVAEKFSLILPEILAGPGFSRLLLAAILLDSTNLCGSQCSIKDKYMATLLIHGAGRFGCNGLYQLRKPEGPGARTSQIGMSSIGMPIAQLLQHENTSAREVRNFQQMEKLRLLMVVSGYYDSKRNFKREILVAAESVELMKNLLFFFDSSASQLPLKAIHQSGLGAEMQAFEIDKVTSRKTIEHLLEEFGGTSKG